MVITLRADLPRRAKGIAALEPCIGFKELQRIPTDEVDRVIDLCHCLLEYRSTIPVVVQEAKDGLRVVLEDELVGVTTRKPGAVRGDGVDLRGLGGEDCCHPKQPQ